MKGHWRRTTTKTWCGRPNPPVNSIENALLWADKASQCKVCYKAASKWAMLPITIKDAWTREWMPSSLPPRDWPFKRLR